MRRVLVALLAVLGLLAVGAGIGLRTIWLPDDTVVARASVADPGVVVTTAPGVLEARPGPVTVSAQAPDDGPVLLAVGRQEDVEAYSDGLARTRLTGFGGADGSALTSTSDEGEPTVADPATSDLWVQRATGAGTATLRYDPPPGRWLLLAAGDGTAPAPSTITLTWPSPVSTPWAVPLVLVGTLLLLAAAVLGLPQLSAVRASLADVARSGRRSARQAVRRAVRRAAARRAAASRAGRPTGRRATPAPSGSDEPMAKEKP